MYGSDPVLFVWFRFGSSAICMARIRFGFGSGAYCLDSDPVLFVLRGFVSGAFCSDPYPVLFVCFGSDRKGPDQHAAIVMISTLSEK